MNPDYDSILTAIDSTVINRSEFWHTGKTVPDHDIAMAGRSYALSNDDFIVGGIGVMFFVFAVIMYYCRKVLFYRIKDFFTSKRVYNEEAVSDSVSEVCTVFLLTTISALSLSLVFFDTLADRFQFNDVLGVPYWVFGVGFVVFMCFIYTKAWIYALVNWVFFDFESNRKWMHGYFLLTSLTAFVFFPLSLVEVFFDNSLQIVIMGAVSVVFVYELLLFYKLFINFKTKKYGYVLIFLYFCSVELIPALVLWNGLGWVIDSLIVKNLLY